MSDSLPTAMQPILCCLGERVAGKPTQFLWERAIAAKELDWRAITIQLDTADLPVALAGMRVMRFMGLRFFPSLQKEAARLLGPDNQRVQFIGCVTSAARTADLWQAWHHWGSAILTWATMQIAEAPTIFWLHGDSVRCRSFFSALSSKEPPLAGSELDPRNKQLLIWSDAPADLPLSWLEGSGVEFIAVETAVEIEPNIDERDEEGQHKGYSDSAETDARHHPVSSVDTFNRGLSHAREQMHDGATPFLVLVGDHLPNFSTKQLIDAAPHCLVASGEEACRKAGKWSHPSLKVLTEVEQLVACEAYDIQRWTGHVISIHLLRDAYDEYNGF